MKFKEYLTELNEKVSRIMVFVDAALNVGAKYSSNIVIQDMGSYLKVLELQYSFVTKEEQAENAVQLANTYNAQVINVWKDLLSHHVSQMIKEKAKGKRVDLISDSKINTGFAADQYYSVEKIFKMSSDTKSLVNRFEIFRAHLYCIANYVSGSIVSEAKKEE